MIIPQRWIIFAAICATLFHTFSTSKSIPDANKIISFPGQPPVSFQQFSGYITIDEKKQKALFYYFVEAETHPASKPLVLWLNGGPGCSSIGAGAFIEHGPFRPSGDILVKNEYSWNKEANMLYLESPAGVGFSYSTNKSFYNYVNDKITALDNLAFLEIWFSKFPQYKNREFFITGESYAGHYVPQLAELIIQSRKKINLKGIAIGNPLLEINTDLNSRAPYYWSHALISDSTYEGLTLLCNVSEIRRQLENGTITPVCYDIARQVSQEIGKYINRYDIALDVCLSSIVSLSQRLDKMVNLEQATKKIDVCVEDETGKYLNRKDVQAALHAKLVGVTDWSFCSEVIHYDSQNLEAPTIHILGTLAKSGIRVLVYSGDQDSVIPFIGTRILVNALAKELGLNTTVPYRAWIEGKQVAGWTQVYGDILSFSTVRGAGHLAPFSQPERSLALFKGFLAGKPLPDA